MKKLFLFFFIASLATITCCNEDNFKLIKTTFQRTFEKDIIKSYLVSDDKEKVQEALLCISHSEDTSFIPEIISLPFSNYALMICFTVGQIGPCSQSTSFLWNKIHSDDVIGNSECLFEALGKKGTDKDLKKIVEWYSNFDGPKFPYPGISLAVRQFAFRRINSEGAKNILIEEVNNPFNSIKNISDALFTLARTGNTDQINETLINILNLPQTENPDTIRLKQFALMNFSAQKFFPNNPHVLQNVLKEKNTLLQIESAKAICFMEMKSHENITSFVQYLDSENPNVSRTAAKSVQFLKVTDENSKNYLKEFLENKFISNITQNTRGELFLSYTSLFQIYPETVNQKFLSDDNIPAKYWFEYLGTRNEDLRSLNELLNRFESENVLSNRISILTSLLNFQKNFESNYELYKTITGSLHSDFAPLVSIASDGIDSLFIARDKNLIIKEIKHTVEKEKDNPDFLEGILSLINLSERTDTVLFKDLIDELSQSELYSVRKFISGKRGQNISGEKPDDQLLDFMKNAFKYKKAEVVTEKGNFKLEFLPQYAPVSVGNFCKLVKDNFYNNVEFHRVVPGFVIQCGDPTATGWGGPGYEIVSEFSPLPYEVGMVGMASAGKDTEGSQWFVMQGNYPHLNGRYSVFAKVTEGMDVVYNIDQNDKIVNITLLP